MDKAAKITYVYNHTCIVYDVYTSGGGAGAIIMIVEEDQRRFAFAWYCAGYRVAVNAVFQESAQSCLARRMLGFGCSKYMHYSHHVNHV